MTIKKSGDGVMIKMNFNEAWAFKKLMDAIPQSGFDLIDDEEVRDLAADVWDEINTEVEKVLAGEK